MEIQLLNMYLESGLTPQEFYNLIKKLNEQLFYQNINQ
jgi:hypothetical protein